MRMRTARIVAAISVIVLGPTIDVRGQAGGPAPRAIAPEAIKDVGAVDRGERITHEFTIRNDGDAVLEISEVKPSCGCTVAEYDRSIAPGGTGVVRATVETKNFKGGIAKFGMRIEPSAPSI